MRSVDKNTGDMQGKSIDENSRTNKSGLRLVSDNSVILRFRRALEVLSFLGSDEGVKLVPYENASLPYFRALTSLRQIELADYLEQYCSVMEEVKRDERHIVRNPNTLWRMLGRMNLRASPDLFESLKDDDVIEVYDLEGHQLYRSFNFFPICTYTLEQIYSVPWFELYERDEEMIRSNLESVSKVLSEPYKGTRATMIPNHEVREISHPVRRCTMIQPRFMSPIFDSSGKVAGFINTFCPLQSIFEPFSVPSSAGNC